MTALAAHRNCRAIWKVALQSFRVWSLAIPVLAIALLFILLASAPVARAASNACAGGGRPRPDEGGVGGTGVRSSGPIDEGGIGGTGISASADTGIIGTITGFGSICVGGVEIHYGTETPVHIDGEFAAADQLAVGQVVEVTADGQGTEVNARGIAVRHIVSGPVTLIEPTRDTIGVMGQEVAVSGARLVVNGDTESTAPATALQLNAFVRVSGFRRADGVIVASRVHVGQRSDLVQMSGPVTKTESGIVWIGATAIRADGRPAVAVGDLLHVTGHWDGATITGAFLTPLPQLPFDGHVARVEIEGFARPVTGGALQIGAFSVEVPPSAALEVQQLSARDTRVRIHAVIQDRRVIVERIGVIDELPSLPAVRSNAVPAPDPSRFGEDAPPREDWGAKPDNGGGPPSGDRFPAMQPPNRPSMPQMPEGSVPGQLPGRPQIPDRPQLPPMQERFQLPERPPRPPDRPQLPPRPVLPMLPARPFR